MNLYCRHCEHYNTRTREQGTIEFCDKKNKILSHYDTWIARNVPEPCCGYCRDFRAPGYIAEVQR